MKPSNETFQIKAIDYLYGEMSETERKEFENLLDNNPVLKADFESLKMVRSVLSEEQASPQKAVKKIEKQTANHRLGFNATILQIAASIIIIWLIILGTATLAGLNFKWDDNGFMMAFGEFPTAEIQAEPLTENFITADLLREYSEIQGELISQALEAERQQQASQLQQLFEEYATLIENRRLIDLQLIELELQHQRDQTDRQFRQAEFVLNELIQFVND